MSCFGTGCDVLWGGCPMVTLPLERMASRVAASLCYATGLGHEMVVNSQQVSVTACSASCVRLTSADAYMCDQASCWYLLTTSLQRQFMTWWACMLACCYCGKDGGVL